MADYTVGYPINFTPDGDYVRDGFYKHIQEILKIYLHLNELKAESGGNSAAIASTNGEMQAIKNALQTSINELSGLVDSVGPQIGTLGTRVGTLETTVGTLETTAGTLGTRVGTLESTVGDGVISSIKVGSVVM
jgi:hypothetical protein